jgi:hypothetical protein
MTQSRFSTELSHPSEVIGSADSLNAAFFKNGDHEHARQESTILNEMDPAFESEPEKIDDRRIVSAVNVARQGQRDWRLYLLRRCTRLEQSKKRCLRATRVFSFCSDLL